MIGRNQQVHRRRLAIGLTLRIDLRTGGQKYGGDLVCVCNLPLKFSLDAVRRHIVEQHRAMRGGGSRVHKRGLGRNLGPQRGSVARDDRPYGASERGGFGGKDLVDRRHHGLPD
jgi:hypothetical protein